MSRPRSARISCPVCGMVVENLRSRFCSNTCQMEQQYRDYIARWKAGLESGNHKSEARVSLHVRRYMFEKCGSHCQECGWSRVNSTTGLVPLTIDHIDGDSRHSVEANLRVLCPNCHSLTPTYGALNAGRGRSTRQRAGR